MNKTDLIQKVKALEGLSQDERAYLLNLVNTKKKYGLVWEDKPEEVEEQLRENLPVLKEVKDKAIVNGEDCPNHILIEGDNLHVLTALTFTHEGKIDVIYIDPPYNTGNKDFKYNDSFVDREDSYRHSKWLSFMSKRLQIGKRLLSEKGVIFISIDDNEQAQLKMLCDEIFGENEMVGKIIWKNVTDNNPTNIASEHEYILCYSKQKSKIEKVWKSTRSYAKEILLKIETELLGKHQSIDFLEIEYKDWFKENKKFLGELDRYKYIDSEGIYTGSQSVHNPGKEGYRYDIIHPVTKKPCKQPLMGYRFPEVTINKFLEEGKILFGEDHNKLIEIKVYAKDYLSKLSSLIELDGRLGANELRAIFPTSSKMFNNPKPVELLTEILSFSLGKSSTILDFFAGSGSSLHSIIELNKEDGGNRQCILVTNNENNICEEVTYERNKRVIQGYTNAKGTAVEGLGNNNLRYYKSAFVGRGASIKNKKEITQLATELLCIKEDMYAEQNTIGNYKLNASDVKCFKQHSMYLLVLYKEDAIEEIVEVIQSVIVADKERKTHFKVYVFSNGQYPYTEEFEEVLPYVTLCALPDAIYKAYQNVLPKRQRKAIPELKEPTAEEVEKQLNTDTTDLFNQR